MPSPRTPAPRLAAVVAVASALVALGVTGAGLLLPAATSSSAVRVVGAVVAIAAAGALLRVEGASRGSIALAAVAVVSLAVCVATVPASPISAPWESLPDELDIPAPTDGESRGRDVEIERGTGSGDGSGGDGVLRLPPGADVTVEQRAVVLVLPEGGRIIIGDALVDGRATVPPGGASIGVLDGSATRDEGGPLGADVGLGGVTVERADGSRAVVGEGVLLDVPTPLETEERERQRDALLAVLLGCFALLAFAPPVVRFSERTGATLLFTTEEEDEEPPAAMQTMEEGLAGVLRSMLADPDPRTSVIGAYARLLTALAESGFARRDEEGPHEHLWRSLGPLGVRRQPVHRLAELFVRARFTPRPVTEADRQAAIAALADAVADLRLQATDVDEAAAAVGVSA